MILSFDTCIAKEYTSNSQRARILTESWMETNGYCPICGATPLVHYEANKPVADFYCNSCKSDYELKSRGSKGGEIVGQVVGGAYETMIKRITSHNNPNFFFMAYNNDSVSHLLMIPNYFFTPTIIEKRKPLSENARRAGWVGCNILISGIPEAGRIYMIRDRVEIDRNIVVNNYAKAKRLETENLEGRGWLLDVLACVDKLHSDIFSLAEVYSFEPELAEKYPKNNNVQAKIRQQLQLLRDRGFIEFMGKGLYHKIG